MNEFQPLIDQLYREEVEAARRLGPEGRMRQALRLLAMNFRWARSLGDAEMKRRYRITRALSEQGCYAPPVQRL